jgi:hypothetical protein
MGPFLYVSFTRTTMSVPHLVGGRLKVGRIGEWFSFYEKEIE